MTANNPAVEKGGPSLNPAGRPKDTPEKKAKRWKRSKLRKTESQLQELNPQAIENIRKSVDGEKIDKEIVNTSKWVVTTTVAVNKAAFSEELELNGVRASTAGAESVDDEDESAGPEAEFTLTKLPTKAHLKSV